jgi:hypothetical protein
VMLRSRPRILTIEGAHSPVTTRPSNHPLDRKHVTLNIATCSLSSSPSRQPRRAIRSSASRLSSASHAVRTRRAAAANRVASTCTYRNLSSGSDATWIASSALKRLAPRPVPTPEAASLPHPQDARPTATTARATITRFAAEMRAVSQRPRSVAIPAAEPTAIRRARQDQRRRLLQPRRLHGHLPACFVAAGAEVTSAVTSPPPRAPVR